MKKLLRSLLRARWFQQAVGFLVAQYLRLVWRTNTFSFDPADVYERAEPHQPLARWRSRLQSVVAQRQAEHRTSGRRIAARLFAERPKAFEKRLQKMWDGIAASR